MINFYLVSCYKAFPLKEGPTQLITDMVLKNKKTAANTLFATGRSHAPRYHPYSPLSGRPSAAKRPSPLRGGHVSAYWPSALQLGDDLLRRLHERSHPPRSLFASADRYSCPSSLFGFIIAAGGDFVNNFCAVVLDKACHCRYNNKVHPGVAQLVARLVRDQEAVGSNPVARTKNRVSALAGALFLFCAARTHGLFSPIKRPSAAACAA